MVNISLLGLRVVKEKSGRYDISKKITSPADVVKVTREVLDIDELAEEIFVMITLDTKNKVSGIFTVSKGSLNSSIVHPREVFKRALLHNSASILLVHNHPSGDTRPSKEDVSITKRLKQAGEILGISVLDHVIVGDNGSYTSMKEQSLI